MRSKVARRSGVLVHPTSFPGNWGIGDLGSAARDLLDLVVCEHEDCVGAWRVGGGVALCEVSEFFAEGPGPRFAEEWVVL